MDDEQGVRTDEPVEEWDDRLGDDDASGAPAAAARRGFFRRHVAFTVFCVVVVLMLGAGAGAAGYLNHQISEIPRIPLQVEGQRPKPVPGKAMNILLAGTDNGDASSPSIAALMAKGSWTPGEYRSDTIMVLHLSADRRHAYLVSIPRDTYVAVAGHGMQKINAAFSYGGPNLYVQTLEQFTGLRMNHLAIIDWNGFRDLSTALGGVRVYVGEDSYDSANGTTWKKGYQTVQGQRALYYVRQRHGLPNGDFDRIRRQQNFLRSALTEAADKGNLTNPIRFKNMLGAVTRNLTVDADMTNGELRDLAWSLRGLRASDITFIQLPFQSFADTAVGSVVNPDLPQSRELFRDVASDKLDRYVAKYGGNDVLAQPTDVD